MDGSLNTSSLMQFILNPREGEGGEGERGEREGGEGEGEGEGGGKGWIIFSH